MIHGALAALALSAVYFAIVGAAQGFPHAAEEFAAIWYLMLPLVIGFGVQVGLFSYIHSSAKAVSSAGVATSGGVSTVSMVACCAHHLTDVLPLIGLTAFALFLTQYQNFFIVLGILSNIVGILFMLGIIQSKKLYRKKSFFGGIFMHDMKKLRNAAIAASVVILIAAFVMASAPPVQLQNTNRTTNNKNNALALPERTNSGNGLTISATPQDFSFGKPVKFDVKFDTHQGALDFDVAKISTLEDSNGKIYSTVSWEGPPPGGHHMEGILTFPELQDNPQSMKLVMRNVYGIEERTFEWPLR